MRHNFVLGRLPCCVTSLLLRHRLIDPAPNAACWMPPSIQTVQKNGHNNKKTATAAIHHRLRSGQVLDQLRERIRYLHYNTKPVGLCPLVLMHVRSRCTSPAAPRRSEVEHFCPGWRAQVSVSTHRRALAALLFAYHGRCGATDRLREIGRPRPSRRLPMVLTPDEVVRILGFLEDGIVCSPSFCG